MSVDPGAPVSPAAPAAPAARARGGRPRRVLLGLAGAVALLVGSLTVAGALYVPDLSIPAGLEGKHATVLGNAIRYVQRGAGPDVLLIHGSPGSLEDWEAVAATLSATHRVTTFDRPGHGYSGDCNGDSGLPAASRTLDAHADAALALIDALDLRDVVVAGHSYGGGTALAMAVRRPAKVRAFVIVDAASYRWLRPPDAIYRLIAIPWLGTGVARAVGPIIGPRKVREGLARVFPETPPTEAFAALRTRIWTQPKVSRSVALEALGADAALAAQHPRYKEIQAPVVILAQLDDVLRREAAVRLAGDIPGARLHLLARTGHYVQVERPADVVAAIEEAEEAARGR